MRRPVPRTLLHRTLVFPLGRAGPRPEASRNAHAFRSHSRLWRVSGPPWTTPGGQPATIMRLGRPQPAPAARGDVLPIFRVGCGSPLRASAASAGFGGLLHGAPTRAGRARGGRASTCAARPWAQPLEYCTSWRDQQMKAEVQSDVRDRVH